MPGDLSTKQERVANENGTFTFYLNQTNTVIGIYESLAGNTFGTKPKKKGSIFKKVIFSLLALIAGYYLVKSAWSIVYFTQQSIALVPENGVLIEDITEEEEKIVEEVVEEVIEASSVDDVVIVETPAPAAVEPVLTQYVNSKYGFSFEYFDDVRLSSLDDFSPDITQSKSMALFNLSDNLVFLINVFDPEPLREYPSFEETISVFEMPLDEFIKHVEVQYLAEGVLNGAIPVTVGGRPGYIIIAGYNYCLVNSCRMLERDTTFFYVENKDGLILEIEVPLGDSLGASILNSLNLN